MNAQSVTRQPTRFFKSLWQSVLKILIYATINNAVFLYLIGEPLSQTRPWTLFLPRYWDHLPNQEYLVWQLFVILNIGQAFWILYQHFKETLITFYYQSSHRLERLKNRSALAAICLKSINGLYIVLLSPITYRSALYHFLQLLLLTFVSLLIWTSFFLAFFHALSSYTLDPKAMLAIIADFSIQTPLHRVLTQALVSASLLILSFVTIIKAIIYFQQKLRKPGKPMP